MHFTTIPQHHPHTCGQRHNPQHKPICYHTSGKSGDLLNTEDVNVLGHKTVHWA